jgi:hypothetical protein
MVPSDTAPRLVEAIRTIVPIVTGTSTLEAPLTMDFSMTDAPPGSHNGNYIYFWLHNTVEAHQLLLDKIVCFTTSDFGGAHLAFRLMITCAVCRYGFLLRTLPPNVCRPYFTTADKAVCAAFSRMFGDFHDVQTLDKLNCAKRLLSV